MTPTPTVLQLTGWIIYLVIVLGLFLRPVALPPKEKPQEINTTEPQPERTAG